MDLGSDSSVSKKDAKLGFVVNYTNLLLIPGPDGQYFTTANLWTWDQSITASVPYGLTKWEETDPERL